MFLLRPEIVLTGGGGGAQKNLIFFNKNSNLFFGSVRF